MASFEAVITLYLAVEIPEPPFVDYDGFVANREYLLAIDERWILNMRVLNYPVVQTFVKQNPS